MSSQLTKFTKEMAGTYRDDPDQWSQVYNAKKADLWQEEVDEAIAKAHLKLIAQFEVTRCMRALESGASSGNVKLDESFQTVNTTQKTGADYDTFWVTVNPMPTVDVAALQKCVSKLCNKKTVKSVEYVFEQRGDSDATMGTGMHAHLLVTRHKATPSGEYRRDTYNTFKSIVGSKAAVHVMGCKPEDVPKRQKYMSGQKTDDKMQKCNYDIEWRLKNKLCNLYNHVNSGGDDSDSSSDDQSESFDCAST